MTSDNTRRYEDKSLMYRYAPLFHGLMTAIATALLTVGIFYGFIQAKLAENDKDHIRIEVDVSSLDERVRRTEQILPTLEAILSSQARMQHDIEKLRERIDKAIR